MANTTARDIARKLGLSTASVSVALNGKPGVSRATREKVLAAAAEMGYAVPKPDAGRKNLLCFLIYSDPAVGVVSETTFYTFVLKGVEAAATALGYRTLIRYYDAHKPFQEQLSDIVEDLAGLLVLATDLKLSAPEAAAPLIGGVPLPFPVVVIDDFGHSLEVDCVGNDNYCGAHSAVSYLLDCGHRRIGYLRIRQRITNFDEREHGVRQALKERLGDGAAPEVIDVDVAADRAFQDVSDWLETRETLPDALFAENDVIAAAAIRALKAHGIQVPQEVSIIGFDDLPLCEMLDPTITTVHSFKERIGSEAMTLLHRRILDGDTVQTARETGLVKLALSTRIVERSSVARK